MEPPLGLFIETAPAALAMFDRQMRYLHASTRWRSDYGLGDRQLIGVSHYEIFPEIPDHWKEIHQRALAGETVRDDHDRFERLDGSVQWLRWMVRPWYEPNRTIGGIVIFSEDVTACTLILEQLRQSEQRYRCLIESTSDIVWNCSRVGERIDVPRWRDLTGQTPEQADNHWQECIHPDDRDAIVAAWLHFIEKGGVFKRQYRLRFRDGKYHWGAVNGVSLNETDGTIREWIGTFNDITDRKHAEEVVRQKEEEYRSIFEQALEGIYRTTPEGKSIAANPALAKILGYGSPEEFVTAITDAPGKMWADPTARQSVAELMERGEVVRGFECQFIRKDGEKIWVSVNGRVVRDSAGNKLYYEGFIEDIHERKLAEQKLRESEARERVRAQQLDTILNTIPVPVLIAHDPECQKITRNRAAWKQLGVEPPESDNGSSGISRELRHRFLQDGTPIVK
jgi:PAS domain S-box-containing protein